MKFSLTGSRKKIARCLLFAVAVFLTIVHEVAAQNLAPGELARFKTAAEYSKSQRGIAVLVMRRGEVIIEDYAPGWNPARPHQLASGTKSFSGIMAACATQDGLLKLDEKVADTLTEWKADPHKSQITIRQLLSLSSGIEGGTTGQIPSYKTAVQEAKTFAAPDEKFSYGPIPYQCFGELLRRKLGKESVEAYLHRRVLDPIGLKVSFWRKDANGNLNLPSGAFLTPREWAKFGELVRQGGKWNGTEIVPKALLDECFKAAKTNPAYGMSWWLLGADASSGAMADDRALEPMARRLLADRQRAGFQPPTNTVAALGKGGNDCLVMPSLELVVIRMGDSQAREFNVNVFLAKLLSGAPVSDLAH
jgi:CubicO group peptidase (beta-lactamase class C family)